MNKKELLRIIDEAAQNASSHLVLSNNKLTELPAEIGNLTNLITLNLSDNQLTELPHEIGNLTNLTTLNLSENQLTKLPPEIGKLINLTKLTLDNNELTELPPEIGKLTNLTKLDLSHNQLTELPPEIGNLTNLIELILYYNLLTELPPEIGNLTNLTLLFLTFNELTELPPEIGNLTKLTELSLYYNQLTELPPEILNLTNLIELNLGINQLTELPPEILNLTNLTKLTLDNNELTELPPDIGNLNNLIWLDLSKNQLTELPPEIGKLTNITSLRLADSHLTELPPEIGNLTNLTSLHLYGNQLTELPPEFGNLTNLTHLEFSDNHLTELPPEFGNLNNLTKLFLGNNKLTKLPPEIGNLTNLTHLDLDSNPLISPSQEIVAQGTEAVLAYLRNQLKEERKRWVSKLLVVGEGGVGKTSVLRALRGEPFETELLTTHGIDIQSLSLDHPNETDVMMQLNTWDFGGQQIYHATHQFFLTNRSLFVLVWNARHGFEQGKLYYWLETIKALAPESPILVVATWLDERDADLPKSELSAKFPQIVDYFEISNKTGTGIENLKTAIADSASGLPLMGSSWPADWLNAAESIQDLEEKTITPYRLFEILDAYGVSSKDARILAQWMHDLGDLLYFQNNDELNDTVILKPQWVTEYISKVLESDDVISQKGIFTRDHMHILWKDLDANTHEHFLSLMEQFDLSYRTKANREISLVVERLPLDPPNYEQRWDEINENNNCREISMKFELSTIPAGVPTWFIARTHRFSTHIHWRNGALFTDSNEEHLALVKAFTNERYLHLTVRGPHPQNFFAILKEGIEVTLKRFPGLQIDRFIPCPGHGRGLCTHQFNYEHLLSRIEERPLIECPESKPLEDVSVPSLLFGIHFHTQDAVFDRIDVLLDIIRNLEATMVDKQDKILAELKELRAELIELGELTQREFTNTYKREQSKIESHCPNVFVLRPRESKRWKDVILGQKIDLQLYCQAPGCWHPAREDCLYTINNPAEWIKATAPYLQKMVKVLKYASPLIGPWIAGDESVYIDMFKNDINLMTELVKKLPDLKGEHDSRFTYSQEESHEPDRVGGAALRALRSFLEEEDLKEEDTARHWGGLRKVVTPEHHYLWLCEHHAEEYDSSS